MIVRKWSGDKKINVSISETIQVNLVGIRLHLNSASTSTSVFNVTMLSGGSTSSPNNALIFAMPMSGIADIAWQPDQPLHIGVTDKISFYWPNDNSSYKTWGLDCIISG